MKSRTKVGVGVIGVIVLLVFSMTFVLKKYEGVKAPPPATEVAEVKPLPVPAPKPPRVQPKEKKVERLIPLPDRLSAIDRALESMGFGNIAFNAPRSMNLHTTAPIQLVLGLAKPIDELKQMIEAEGEKEGARIRVSDRMEARLSGSNFAITAITPEIQSISRSDVTEWKWEVKPNSEGHQHLHLTVSALLSVDGTSIPPRTVRTFDKVIEVEVTLYQRVGSFFEDNWKWLWAAVLAPLVGWLLKKGARETKSNVA